MYYVAAPSNKVAQKLMETFLQELETLRRKPKMTAQELKNFRRLRKALTIVGGKK